MPQCAGIKRDGSRCSVGVPPGVEHCYNHDPARADERRRNASRAGRRRPNNELAELKAGLADLYDSVLAGLTTPKVGAAAAQIAGARIRLLEVARRIKETEELEERLEALERIQDNRRGGAGRWR